MSDGDGDGDDALDECLIDDRGIAGTARTSCQVGMHELIGVLMNENFVSIFPHLRVCDVTFA